MNETNKIRMLQILKTLIDQKLPYSLYVTKTRSLFLINFLASFTSQRRLIFKIASPMNSKDGSFLKPV